jgi:HEAT repeat protein
VHKAKRAYLRAKGATGLGPLPGTYAVKSSIDATLDASGWPRTLTEDGSLDVTAGAIHVVSTSKTKATLVAVEKQAPAPAPDPASLQSDVESEAEGFARARTNAAKNLVAGRSFKDLAAAFHAPETKKRNDAMAAMGALFRVEPGATAEAGEAVLHGKLDVEGSARITAALGSAGTPEAQQTLASIIASPDADSTRVIQATAALGQTAHPLPDNEEVLEKTMTSDTGDVSTAATLALGSNIRTQNAEQLGDTTSALQTLLDGLAGATTDAARRVYLLALGNTGDARALDAIEPYLTSPDVDLRVAAATALRQMPGARAEKDLQTALADGNYLVRRAAVEAIGGRPDTDLVPVIEQMLHTDPEASVRIAIVSVLYAVSDKAPSALDALRWAAGSDPSPKVREAAKSFLALEG